jgi:DNA-binding protein HU-beta
MNRKELSAKIADRTGLGFQAADDAVKAFAEIVAETLSDGDTVRLQGFGTFKVVEKETRQVYNPASGTKEERKPEKVPVFKAAPALKECVG